MKFILLAILTIAAPQLAFAASYQHLLQPNETVLKVVYPKGRDPIAKRLAVVYYAPKNQVAPEAAVRAFAVYHSGKKVRRMELKEGQILDEGFRVMCGDAKQFDRPLSDAEVIQLTPHATPQLVLSGIGSGSAGYTTIAIFTLYPVRLSETRHPMLCAESQLEKECDDWAAQQNSPTRTNRWLHAESIDDIQYVMRQVRGE